MMLVCAIALLAPMQAQAGKFIAVDGGRAKAVIVVPADATDVHRLAAKELSRYVEKATSARLPVVQARAGRPSIELVSQGPPLPHAEYRMEVTASRVAVVGNCPVGVLFGVYDFLARFVGCRWYVGGEIGEVVPRRKTIAIPTGRYIGKPAFAIRSFFLGREEEMWWALRNRLNGFYRENFVKELGSGVGPSLWIEGPRHAFSKLVPPARWFEDHPEYFALIDGRRSPRGQLCTTNPDVIDLIAEKARRFFREHPSRWCFSICPNDGYGWCECDRCRALDEELGGARKWAVNPKQPVVTDRLLHFANQVAEKALPGFPGRELYVYAYVNYAPPPQVEWPGEGVVAWLCHYLPACYAHAIRDASCEANRQFYEYLRTWTSRVAERMGFYAYTDKSMWAGLPRPVVLQMADDIKLLAELGVRRYVAQSSARNWGQMEALYWITAQLLWDPNKKVEELRRDWYEGFFGPAAAQMRAYYDTLDRAVRKSGLHYNNDPMREGPPIFTQEVMASARAKLAQAEAAAQSDEVVLQRISVVRRAFDHADRMLRFHRVLARFNSTGNKQALAEALELGRALAKGGGYVGRRYRKLVARLEQFAAGGLAWSGFGDEVELGGRLCRNSDETGPGDGAAGWATLSFLPEKLDCEYRLTLVVWGKSQAFTPVICSAGQGAGTSAGGKWTPLGLVEGKLSGQEQWDTLVYRVKPDQFDKSRRLQVIGLGGGDSQIWIAEARIEPAAD